MSTLGLDLTDDSLKGTPRRVAKMYVKEIFSGLDPKNKPVISLFENKYKYNQMLVEKDISFYSNCEHHFVPITGKAHVAYIPNGWITGLSKIARVVDVFSRRLQVQERLTTEILGAIQETLQPLGVAVVIEANHLCMMMRGVQKQNSTTTTSAFWGEFEKNESRSEFIRLIGSTLH
jgi:GTP cyclohydrolase I